MEVLTEMSLCHIGVSACRGSSAANSVNVHGMWKQGMPQVAESLPPKWGMWRVSVSWFWSGLTLSVVSICREGWELSL